MPFLALGIWSPRTENAVAIMRTSAGILLHKWKDGYYDPVFVKIGFAEQELRKAATAAKGK